MKATCAYCGKQFEKSAGHLNRANKLGVPVYCDRKCAGLGRRTNETDEEKIAHKQWYDLFIRESMTDDERDLKALQAAVLFDIDYTANPEKYRQWRQKRMPKHIEYCRQPGYKVWKKSYDENYRAQKDFGEFGEAAVILKRIDQLVDSKKLRIEKDCHNKRQKRLKIWKNLMQ